MKQVHVAVGVILREQQVFLCKRPTDKHQGGKWEFPGGKVEEGESAVTALTRELDEEVGIHITHTSPLVIIEHDYGDKQVILDVHTVTAFTGEPFGKEGQTGKWTPLSDLRQTEFPEANVAIIDALYAELATG